MVVGRWSWLGDRQERPVNILPPVVKSVEHGISEVFKDVFDNNIVDMGGNLMIE